MGYSEVYCHICGVSFNINRFRTDTEPRSAAWGNDSDFASCYGAAENCAEQERCFFVDRDAEISASSPSPKIASLEPGKILLGNIQPTDSTEDWEHVPGPECQYSEGYNGHHISVEAMRGCTTLQCLVRKSDDWELEGDDEEFEASGHFFLSGLSDHMPSRDMSSPSVFPERHGTDMPNAENCIWGADEAEDYSMPFHPTCLEVFKRASIHRYGVVDIECLTQWWGLEATYKDFHTFPRHSAVTTGQDQTWNHAPGDEFLAANPCFVPGLETLLSLTQCSKEGYSEVIPTAVSTRAAPTDLFSRLPREIRLFILLQLGFKDIAHLRLVSRAFLQLPQSLFYQLTLRDTPWLYEAWSSLPISFWATTTQAEEKRRQNAIWDRAAELRNAEEILEDEAFESGDPDYNKAAIEAIAEELGDLPDYSSVPRPATEVILLKRTETDWHRLQTEVSRNWKKLLGLRNRRRIWDDCQEILNRVDAYRKQGKIHPGQAVDVAEVARRATERQIEEGRRWARYCAAGRQGRYNPEDWA